MGDDVGKAVNLVNWCWIKRSFAKLDVPCYLAWLIASYISETFCLYETNVGLKEYITSAGGPQVSVLGPLMKNIMHDGALGLRLSEKTM